MRCLLWLVLLPDLLLGSLGVSQTSSDLVNPLIGTAAQGQTFPIAGVPFAMTDWTPQTRDGETKCIAPYYAADTRIQGFRGSHFMSGSCTQDYGSFTLMPVAGSLKLQPEERASRFLHGKELAHPYLYSVDLLDYGIHAEATGTAHSGMMRFRYRRGAKAWVVIQTNNRPDAFGASVHVDAARNEVWGENPVRRLYAGAGKPAGFNGYFVIQFDHPIASSGSWQPNQPANIRNEPGVSRGAFVSFKLAASEPLQARIGTSFTSLEEARANLHSEIPEWDFNGTVSRAKTAWEEVLGAVRIAGDAPQRSIFYTAMYHSFLLPRIASDVDGSYPRFAGNGQVETASNFTYYDDFSLWDTFRALHPLLALLDPHREGEMVESLIAKGTQGGFLPIYPAWSSYTAEMIGDHANAVIVDAYRKGILNFDIDEAYRLIRKNATEVASQEQYADGRGRRALTSYLEHGFVPLEDHVPLAFHTDEQVSRTLDYAYDDALAGILASGLGKTEDAALFARRAGNWRNVIDPVTGFARGRHADGSWVEPFDPCVAASYITEGLPIQYTFFVPQDIPGLIEWVGGKAAFEAKLDTLFAQAYYDQGNEPSHHLAYLYNDIGASWKTQERLRAIMDKDYTNRAAGLVGNDDAGQMSAWYVFSALGFYPVTPGFPEYEIGTPRFDDVTLTFRSGHTLHILAHGAEKGLRYIRSVRLNGQPVKQHTLLHSQLIGGGVLEFTMSGTPNSAWPSFSP